MSRLIRPFDPNVGPLISVLISDPYSRRSEFDSPKSERAMMLIDTGAMDSAIAEHLVGRLGLEVTGLHEIHGWGGQKASLQYVADLDFQMDDGLREFPNCNVLRFESNYGAIQGIVGRDILQRARFTLDGPRRQFTLEF